MQGVWDILANNSDFSSSRGGAWPGIPVLEKSAVRLGSDANITSVTWRVDGADVREIDGVRRSKGQLASPEYLAVSFDAFDGPLGGTLRGALNASRSDADAADLVEAFLRFVRGDGHDNRAAAEAFAPVATEARYSFRPMQSGEPVPPSPPDVRLTGGFTVAETLSDYTLTARMAETHGSITFSWGPWEWGVAIPGKRNTTYEDHGRWMFAADARDWMWVEAITAREMNNTTLVDGMAERFAAWNVTAVPGAWEISPEGWGRHYCRSERPIPPQT